VRDYGRQHHRIHEKNAITVHPCLTKNDVELCWSSERRSDRNATAKLPLVFSRSEFSQKCRILPVAIFLITDNNNSDGTTQGHHPSLLLSLNYIMDPRVSTVLSRLGGLYRDPSRVDRDASALLKSSVGQHLVPNIAPLVENNGDSHSTLALQGTIAMHFRGNTYQLLVDIYLPQGYPSRPPVAYVRLGAPNMYLKENHSHVGSDGHVYLPYLHEWRPHTHNLIELVVAMSSVFSADPPVFTRSTPPAAAASTRSNSDQDAIAQVEAAILREATEASLAEEAARREAARAAQEEEEMRKAQLEFDKRKTLQVKEQLTQKIRQHLLLLSQQTAIQIRSDQQDQERLNRKQLQKQLHFLSNTKKNLQKHHQTLDAKTEEIQLWIATCKSVSVQDISVDDLCTPSNPQMMDLAAENASLTDALYFLDRALQKGTLDLSSHLKHVRSLAKRQFLVRATLHKVSQQMMLDNTRSC
jgi:ESCRT-I complex subunit TSG101